MKKVNAFTVLASCMLLVSGAYAATYYVSEFGDDETGDGSATTPWATIQKAVDTAAAGDTVMVQFGEYVESVVPKANGTVGSPVVIMAEEKGEPTITTGPALSDDLTYTLHSGSIYVAADVFRDVTSFSLDGTALTGKDHLDSLLVAGTWFQDRATAKLYVWSGDGADPTTHTDTANFAQLSVDIFEGSYITIDGFVIKNGIKAVTGANEAALPGLVIQNNVFDNDELGFNAVYINGGEADSVHTYEDFLVADNIFENNATLFIYNAGRNSFVSGNTFNGNPLEGATGDANIRLRGSGDYPGAQCQGLVIERNFFNHNNHRNLYFKDGDIDSVTVQNNIFFGGKFGTLSIKKSTNIDILNNTFFWNAHGTHMNRFYAGAQGRAYNNIIAYVPKSTTWFVDNKTDPTLLVDIDYNYYVTDTSLTSSRDDQLSRIRIVGDSAYVSSSSFPGGPHAVYGHPMIARPDSLIIPGDTLYFDSTRVLLSGDTVAVDSIPDMWSQDAYPLFVEANEADTASRTPENLGLVEGSKAIDAAFADLAPELDFFGYLRDENPDIGAIEFGGGPVSVKELLNRLFPAEYELSQNYPNPFNPVTNIEYKLPQAGFVKLTVYNLLGQKVVTLVDGIQRNGTHSVTWNSRDRNGNVVPSGIYFYRLEAGSVSLTAKMLLLK